MGPQRRVESERERENRMGLAKHEKGHSLGSMGLCGDIFTYKVRYQA